jgi:serine protease Do
MRIAAILLAGLTLFGGTALAQEASGGWIGAEVQDLTKEEAAKLGWPSPHGARVVTVDKGGPAADAGLAKGDVIDIAAKQQLDNKAEFGKLLAGNGPGTVLTLRIKRGAWFVSVAAASPSISVLSAREWRRNRELKAGSYAW